MKLVLILLLVTLTSTQLNSQIKFIKKDQDKLLFDGYYLKKDSVKFIFSDLNSASSTTITKNLPLDNNPSCIDLSFERSGTLFLSFSSYTSTYLMGVTSNTYSATVVADIEFITPSSTELIISSHTFTITNVNPGTTDFNKHALNKHILKVNVTDLKEISSNTISQINVKISDFSYSTSGVTNFTNKFKEEINFETFYIEDLSYDINMSDPLISVDYSNISNSYTYKYINDESDNNFRKVRLKWNNLTCDDYVFDNYQVQLLKLVNLEDKTRLNDDFTEFSNTITTVDWSKATTFEIGNSNTFLDLYLTKGKGFYTWRVRPISYYHGGEMTNPLNYGDWNDESMNQGDIFDINNNLSSNTFYYLYYDDQNDDLTDNLNWQHTRVFNEGDIEGSQHYDEIIYSDNLLGKRQYQKKLNHNDYQILSEFIPDHTGRAVLTSIPVPASAISNWETKYNLVSIKADHGTDLLYKNNVFGEPSNEFSIAQFDLGNETPANDVVKNPTSIPEQESGYPNGLIMDYYNSSSTPNNVPKTQGYPFSRVIFYNDGTERVREEIIPDSYKYLQSNKDLGSIKYFYSSATELELLSLFGKEAPDSSKVFKQYTKDENNLYHVNYKDNKGNIIASAILKKNSDNHEQIQNSDNSKELKFEGEVGTYPLNTSYNPKSSINGINYEFNNKGKFFLLNPESGTFTYNLLSETLTLSTCSFSNITNTFENPTIPVEIPYDISLDFINADEFYSEAMTSTFSSTTSNIFNLITPSSSTVGYFEGIEPANYSVNRNLILDSDSINNYFINYRNSLNNHFFDERFIDVFELIDDYNNPSSTLTFESFLDEVDQLGDVVDWVKTELSDTQTSISFSNVDVGSCLPTEFQDFEFIFDICPSSTFPCGEFPDYEQNLIDTYLGREYFVIDGSNTFSYQFTDNIDEFFYRKYNNNEPSALFLKASGEDYISNPILITEASYTYTVEESKTYSSNRGAINKLIENMLNEIYSSSDYQVRNNDLYVSNGINYIDIDDETKIWTDSDICECWNKAISNFGNEGLKKDGNGDYVLNKDFDLLNDFLNCTGRMLRGFTNTAFLNSEIGIDETGFGTGEVIKVKDTFIYQDTLFGGGYITNAHKYIWSDFVNSSTFNDYYTKGFSDLQWFDPITSPSSKTATFINGFEEFSDGGISSYSFTLISNPAILKYDDPKFASNLQKYNPRSILETEVSNEDLMNFSFNTNYAFVSGEIQAFRKRPNNYNTHLNKYIYEVDPNFSKFIDLESNPNSHTFNMQWEKLYNDWIGENYNLLELPDLGDDQDVDLSKRIDDGLKEIDDKKPENVEYDLEDLDDEYKVLLEDLKNSNRNTTPLEVMLNYMSTKCIEACEIRDVEAAIVRAYRAASENYLIETENYWVSPQKAGYSVIWTPSFPEGYLLDSDDEIVEFDTFEMQFVSSDEINDYVNQIVTSCKIDCEVKKCGGSIYDNNTKSSKADLFSETIDEKGIDIKNVNLGRSDDVQNNSTNNAIQKSCYEIEYERLTKLINFSLEVQIPIKDCNGNKQICEYVPIYDNDRYTAWKTTKNKNKLIWEGQEIYLPESEEQYRYELQKVLDVSLKEIDYLTKIQLKDYYSYLSLNFPEELDFYYFNSLTYLSNFLHKMSIFLIIKNNISSFDKRINFNYEFLNNYSDGNPIPRIYSRYALEMNLYNNDDCYDFLNTKIWSYNSFAFYKDKYNYYSQPQLFNIPGFCIYNNESYFNVETPTNYSIFPKVSFSKQFNMIKNYQNYKSDDIINYNEINKEKTSENWEVNDNLVVNNNFIYFNRKIKGLNSFNNNLIKNNALISNKLLITNPFINNNIINPMFELIYGENVTINPAWSVYYENGEPVFNGEGEFIAIPPYPEPEEFEDSDKFVCYRYYWPVSDDDIKNDLYNNPVDCQETEIMVFENKLMKYIDDWTEALIQNSKDNFNASIETFVNNLDVLKIQQDDQDYQKVTLLYYDNSNNLVQSTPPKGVDIDETGNTATTDVDETLETIYQYNSLGQIKTSKTPDQNNLDASGELSFGGVTYKYKGETIYIYDLAGRLRITVNPKQIKHTITGDAGTDPPAVTTNNAPKAMYYKYDKKGRMVETGEYTGLYLKYLSEGDEYSNNYYTLGQYLEKYLKMKNIDGKTYNQVQLDKADFAKYQRVFEKFLLDSLTYPNDDGTLPFGTPPYSSVFPTYQLGSMGSNRSSRFIGLKTISIYDIPTTVDQAPDQNNLQNRISEIIRIPDSYHNKTNSNAADYVSSIYSYDVHGNVDWYYQYMVLKRYSKVNGEGVIKGKLVNYDYDLLSGKVNDLIFQNDSIDEFTQKFKYDADNRLTTVASSRYDINVEKDVEYYYSKHGPLERKVLGNDQVQGIDYYYTIHGWLKGINSLNPEDFLGGDAGSGYNKYVPSDVFSTGLRYYDNDFEHYQNNDDLFANTIGGMSTVLNPQYNGNISEWESAYSSVYVGIAPNNLIDVKYTRLLNQFNYDLSGRLINSSVSYSNVNNINVTYTPTTAFSASFNYDLNGNMYDIERNDETGTANHYDIALVGETNQLDTRENGGNTYNYDFDEMGQMTSEYKSTGLSTYEDVVDTVNWTADGKINYIVDGTNMTYPGTMFTPEVIFPRKHYYYDGMGNRVAIVTEDVNTINGNTVLQSYCDQVGIPYQDCEDCRKQLDFTVDTYYYEAGGKLLYKSKFSNHTNVTYVCSTTDNDVEWYVYGSASDGRVATVYPRFPILDNDELYDDNFEDSPPSPAVAYNTEMVSNTFTAVAESAGITGIETHRHLGEKRYEIKDHLGNVRAVVSDIKNADDYSLSASTWKFLADVRSLNNYYPYGSLISAGSWSGSSYNYGYNGMLKEAIGDDISHTHFRNLSVGDFVGWWSPDPLEFMFPGQSPYLSMDANPINFTDPFGLCGDCPTDGKDGDKFTSKAGGEFVFEEDQWVMQDKTLNETIVYADKVPISETSPIVEQPHQISPARNLIYDMPVLGSLQLSYEANNREDYFEGFYYALKANIELYSFGASSVALKTADIASDLTEVSFNLYYSLNQDVNATGQRHHLLSNKIMSALSKHENLSGKFNRNDERFIYKAFNLEAHRGYQHWHRDYDILVSDWINKNKNATPQQFLIYLHNLHQEQWLKERIPNVNLIK